SVHHRSVHHRSVHHRSVQHHDHDRAGGRSLPRPDGAVPVLVHHDHHLDRPGSLHPGDLLPVAGGPRPVDNHDAAVVNSHNDTVVVRHRRPGHLPDRGGGGHRSLRRKHRRWPRCRRPGARSGHRFRPRRRPLGDRHRRQRQGHHRQSRGGTFRRGAGCIPGRTVRRLRPERAARRRPGRRPRLRLRGSRRPRLRPRRARGRPRRPPPPFRFGRPPDADHPHPDRPGRRWRRPLVDGSPRPVLARLTRSGRTRPEARAISPHPPRPSGSAPRSRTVPRSLSVDQVPGRPAASTARARRLRLRFSLRPRLRLSATGRTTGAALLGAALVAGSLAGALPRAAAAVDATPLGTWTTNGDVNSVFAAGGRIYLGGDFDQVGPDTGSGVPLDAATGARPAVFPQVNGPVFAAVPDGSGGWYIGGLFTRVGDKSRQNAARILADGTVGGWNPNTDSTVRAIAVSKAPGANVAWIGGDFTVLNKASTPVAAGGLAATNANTGAAIWGLPSSSGGVAALALSADGSRLIAGGYFTIFGGAARSHIAAVDPATGALQPSFSAGADDAVRALAAAPDGRVFAGGDFTRIGGGGSAHLAALTGTGSADPAWQTAADGRVDGLALSADGSRLYAAGAFGQIGG